MEAPRRLYTTEQGEICEADDPRARFLLCAKGMPMSEEEANRVGLVKYLEAYNEAHARERKVPEKEEQAEAKAVEQAEVEDKAVKGPTEEKADAKESHQPDDPDQPKTGVDFPPETRRLGSERRRGST